MSFLTRPLPLALLSILLLASPSFAQIETVSARSQPGLRLGGHARAGRDLDSASTRGATEKNDSDLPNLEGINISAEFLFRAEDIQAGNVIAPSASGHFEQGLFGGTRPLRGQWYVNLAIQAPSTAADSAAYLNRLLASGGTGNLSIGSKAGLYGPDNRRGVILSFQGRISWTNQQHLTEGAIPSLGFGTLRLSGSAWAGPIIGAVELSGNRLLSDPGDDSTPETAQVGESKDQFKSGLEGPLSVVVSTAIKFTVLGPGSNAPQYLTIRYLVPTGEVRKTNNLEIRFAQTLDLFR
ncbi:MAG TPA: hypothetical protein VFS20_10930 [Longimicrobium sp.]|nr:hypothetical protein [Longimicrobium sp.]